MKATKMVVMVILPALLLTSCASRGIATPQTGAYEPVRPLATEIVEQDVVIEMPPSFLPTRPVEGSAPIATEAPAAEGAPIGMAPAATASAPMPPSGYPPNSPIIPGYPVTPPRDNYFQDYGVNPFEDPREDHLSTFALDVDTASYSVARRYVTEGILPPAEAVRVEEFVNYFDPGYRPPEEVAFAIYADGAPSPFHHDGSQLMRIGIQGYSVTEAERKPASLTFVIDISGSMEMENRLGLVKRSLELLVENLHTTDTVSIVVYGSEAYIVLFPTSGKDKGTILDAIYSLQTEGATNAEAGLRLGYQLALENFRHSTINRVILCSDGVANVGVTGPGALIEQIRGYTQAGITLTTVGFGMGNFNDILMEQLADHGDGSYAYVDNIDEAKKLFIEDLTGTLQVIARDAKVQVDFNPEIVSRYRLIGYENRAVADQDFRNDYVDAGEIGAGHSAVALYAVLLHPGAQGRIATVQLRWQDPSTFMVTEINGNFNTWDLAPAFESAAPHFQLTVVVAQYAELLRNSPWVSGGSVGQILPYAEYLSRVLGHDRNVSEFAQLVARAAQIRH